MVIRFESVEHFEELLLDPDYEPDDEIEFCRAARELYERELGKDLLDRILYLPDEIARALDKRLDELLLELENEEAGIGTDKALAMSRFAVKKKGVAGATQ